MHYPSPFLVKLNSHGICQCYEKAAYYSWSRRSSNASCDLWVSLVQPCVKRQLLSWVDLRLHHALERLYIPSRVAWDPQYWASPQLQWSNINIEKKKPWAHTVTANVTTSCSHFRTFSGLVLMTLLLENFLALSMSFLLLCTSETLACRRVWGCADLQKELLQPSSSYISCIFE